MDKLLQLQMTEVEFKALEILENGFQRMQFVNISWNGDALEINGPLLLTDYTKRDLNRRLLFLKNKESEEIYLDEEDRKYVKDVIGQVHSKDTICVYDEKKSRVVIYSDKHDDIRQFKHQLNFKTGKIRETRRSSGRFLEDAQSLKTSQENLSSSVRLTDVQRRFSWSKDASNVKIFYTKENIKVAIYNANILDLPVECIVNSANDNLTHSGGVAKVISDAAGPELVQEGNAIIRKKGKIPVCCQVTTTAGRLPYKCVIHTVGPCWSDYQPHNLQKVTKCEEDLYAAIFGCFLEAEKSGVSTVALPAVSSGISAVPQDVCAVQYTKAVLAYSRQSIPGKSLKEIHFIDKFPHLVGLMQYTFGTMFKYGKVPNYDIQNYVASSSTNQRQESKETGRKGRKKQDISADNSQNQTAKLKELSPLYYEPLVQHKKQFVFQVSSKPIVCIYEGDILKVKNMDAVVCPVDTKGNGKGRIALELGKKRKYKKIKEKCFESEKPYLGDVVIICRKKTLILHVVIENDFSQKPDFTSTMKTSLDNILRKTNECVKVKTIALPLFGVDPDLLTEKSWAELFLDRFVAFCCEVKNPNLKEVHIITDFSSSSAYSTVKNVFIKFADNIKNTCLEEKASPPKPIPPKVSRIRDDKQNDMGVNMVYQWDEKDSNANQNNKEDDSVVEDIKDPSLKEGIKRVFPSTSQHKMPLPSHWTSMKVTDVLQVPLDPKDKEAAIRDEYSMVKRDFDKTMSHAEIVSIKRIQNALLWEHYTLQKKEMEIKAGGMGLANEMQLYHGTTPDAVDLICHSNFDFRMAGERVGALLGQGAYFASNAKYSDCYAVTDDKNHKFMFVAKVLVGKICLGNPDFKRPPYLDINDKKRGIYNTCVNNVSNPTVYCVFDRNQYYPEYLLEYTL